MSQKTKESSESYLSLQEIRKLISSISDMRDKLMIRLLYETGCTLIELVNIKVSDILGNKIKIFDPETRELRFSRISGKLAKDLSFYIRGNNLSKGYYILSTRQSKQISEKRVRQLIQDYTKKISSRKINPQMFRYYHIIHAYQNGVLLENIAKQRKAKFIALENLSSQYNGGLYPGSPSLILLPTYVIIGAYLKNPIKTLP